MKRVCLNTQLCLSKDFLECPWKNDSNYGLTDRQTISTIKLSKEKGPLKKLELLQGNFLLVLEVLSLLTPWNNNNDDEKKPEIAIKYIQNPDSQQTN